MGAILGQRSSANSKRNQESLPKIRNKFPFIFQAHPFRYYFDEADFDAGNDGWLPALGRINVSPGVGGVGDGNVTTMAEVKAADKQWVVLKEGDPRLGPYAFYTQRFPSAGRSAVYGSIWDSVKLLGGKVLWQFDEKGYREFLRYLVDSGVVPAIDENVKEMMTDDKRTKLDRMEGRLSANPNNSSLALKVKKLATKIAKQEGVFVQEAPAPVKAAKGFDAEAERARIRAEILAEMSAPEDEGSKDKALELIAGGAKPAQVAKILSIKVATVNKWVRESK